MRALNDRLVVLMEKARGLERLNAKMKVTLTEEVVDIRQVVQVKVERAGYQEERRKLEEKKRGLVREVEVMARELERLRVENRELRQNVKEVHSKSKRNEATVSRLKRQKEELRGKISLGTGGLTEAKGRLVRERQRLAELGERLVERGEEVAEVKRNIESRKERLEAGMGEGEERAKELELEVGKAYQWVLQLTEVQNSETQDRVTPSHLLEQIQTLRIQSRREQNSLKLKYNSHFFDSLHVLHAMHVRERALAVVSEMLLRESREKEEVLGKKVVVLERTGGRLVKELKRREVEMFEGKMRMEEDQVKREEELRGALGKLEEQRKARAVLLEESSMLEMEIRVFKTLLDQASHNGCH